MSQRVSLLSITALFFAVAAPAEAQNEPFIVRVRYEAPAGCPTEEAFLHQVSQRAHHTRFAEAEEPAREFRAVITQGSTSHFSAHLGFIDAESHPVSREVDGNSCNEVAEALVLITALAIDPLLSEPKPEPPANENPGRLPSPKEQPRETLRSTTVAPIPQAADAIAHNEPNALGVAWALGVAVGAVSDAAPSWAPSMSAFLGMNSRNRHSSLRMDVSYSETTPSRTNAPIARYRLLAAALEGCPWSVAITNGVRIWPCAAFETGAFNARGLPSSRLPLPESNTNLWLAADLDLRAGIDFGRRLQLEFSGKTRFPLIRNSYAFEQPRIEAHKVPAVGAAVYVGLAVFLGG